VSLSARSRCWATSRSSSTIFTTQAHAGLQRAASRARPGPAFTEPALSAEPAPQRPGRRRPPPGTKQQEHGGNKSRAFTLLQ
jgi:hypothetical protein